MSPKDAARGAVAGLPMYDWPEVHNAVDVLWSSISARLGVAGIDAPASVWRPSDIADLWDHPDLLVGETCGVQIFAEYRGRHEVLGVLDHAVDGCRPGEYRSVVVVRIDDPADELHDLRGRTVAINERRSYSGYGVLLSTIAPLATDGRFFGGVVETGAHRSSIREVAEGRADVASIDAVSWRLALDHEPAVDGLRILVWTEPAPAPPVVTGWANSGSREALVAAIGEASTLVDLEVREALHLYGFVPRRASDYDVLVAKQAAAAAAGYPAVA